MMDWVVKAATFSPPHFKTSLCAAAVSILIWKTYRQKLMKKSCDSSDTLNVRETLFFRNEGKECFYHLNKDPCELGRYCPAFCLRTMTDYLESARESIEICILHLTIECVENVLIKAHSQGVKIRIFADEVMLAEKSRVPELAKKGVAVKTRKNFANQMHNKFIILDRKILMTGSLNWTLQGICGNWDNIMITSEPRLVSRYYWEFEDLWHVF